MPPPERARKRDRARTKNTNVFGYVNVYEHEHVYVGSSTLRPLSRALSVVFVEHTPICQRWFVDFFSPFR
jgi:hypothetical protein